MKTIVIWTRPITFNCIFTFHTTNRQSCYFHKKIKLFHSKRSTIFMLCKNSKCRIQTKEWAVLMLMENAFGSHSICNWNFTLHRTIVCHRFTYYSISFTSHTTHLIFPFFYRKRIKCYAVFFYFELFVLKTRVKNKIPFNDDDLTFRNLGWVILNLLLKFSFFQTLSKLMKKYGHHRFMMSRKGEMKCAFRQAILLVD